LRLQRGSLETGGNMVFSVKKLIFYGILLIFVSFSLSSCIESPENIGEPTYTNVEYSPDGKSITIYLDGSAPVRTDRALTQRLAILGHNYFEVIFLYNDNGTTAGYKIARAEWELGEPAGVNNVHRTDGGVDYSSVGIPATTGQGTAVLFVGRRSDKTLLAVGVLSHVYEGSTDTFPNITTGTTKVSFDVNALKAGVTTDTSTNTSTSSSFYTNRTQANPIVNLPGKIGGKDFPYFYLAPSTAEIAHYKFTFSSATHAYSFYQPAIIYAGGAVAEIIKPKWTFPPNIEKSDADYEYSISTTVSISTGVSAGSPCPDTVNFTINTAPLSPSIAALTFTVPVYAVYSTSESVEWYLRPGYGNYARELDDGSFETGGAVLLGIGVTGGGSTKGVVIEGDLQKYYPPSNLAFNLTGIVVYFKDGVSRTNITPSPDYWSYYNNAFNPGPNVKFYYDDYADGFNGVASVLMPPNFSFDYHYYGQSVAIRVVYTDTAGVEWGYRFVVEVNDVAAINIPYENRIFLAKPNDFSELANRVANESGNGSIVHNYLFIFSENVNLGTMTFNLSAPVTIYMVAVVPNVIVGRSTGARITASGSQLTLHMGIWPFNDPAFAGGDVITNEPFSINAGGSWENFSAAATEATNMFGGTMTVHPLSGMTINNSHRLGP